MLAELMLPAVLASCLVWRLLAPRARRLLGGAYLVLGVAAIFVHSFQGLFNPSTRTWNETPDVDSSQQLIFDWRHPQFLASERSIERRLVELQRRRLRTYVPGERLAWDAPKAVFRGWSGPESGWRWSDGTEPSIELLLGDLGERSLDLLEIEAGALGRQQVAVTVNSTAAGRFELEGQAPQWRLLTLDRGVLRPNALNTLRFEVPGARTTEADSRLLGIALVSLRIVPLTADFGGVGHDDEAFFVDGFSAAEAGWRWTDGARAAVDYPVGDVAGDLWVLELTAGALGEQRVRIRLGGIELGEAVVSGFDATAHRFSVDAASLRPLALHRVELELPDARRPEGDGRLLGLAFRRLRLVRPPPQADG